MESYFRPRIANSIKRGAPKKRFELSEKQIKQLRTIGDIVLTLGTFGRDVALSVLAPNIFNALGDVVWARTTYRNRDTKWRDQQRKITKTFYYLKSKKYIELIPKGDDFIMKITKKGRKKIKEIQFANLQVTPSDKWNGHWWLVLADVPSKTYRQLADQFREKLKAMKFYSLQRTVWVFPFDPRDEVDGVAARYGIDHFVTTMEVVTLEEDDEKVLRGHFFEKGILKH